MTFNHYFKFQEYVCNGCMVCRCCVLVLEIIFIMIVKKIDYCCINDDISKSEAINLLKNSVLESHGYT